MILVTSPPACGKTYISKQLAKNLKHVVYLDKDTLIPLSNRVFAAAGEEINRSSDFFEKNIRNYEYETIVDLGLEALDYDDLAQLVDQKQLQAFRKNGLNPEHPSTRGTTVNPDVFSSAVRAPMRRLPPSPAWSNIIWTRSTS